ncbi:unnamed protein product [Bursaphelenchus xylophilus]|uniref:(pine wood nematode) hypothetical protein n=1 Tax=Bursaphelenchus xylophilus TaxID=6326 RepID=A0A1I7S2J9_BURXY|nr:unnamed protein product [Bursaphelenchus xylophilus]CAG9121899.1 unnamed protein product [Bursaphelenchus xylophilus]
MKQVKKDPVRNRVAVETGTFDYSVTSRNETETHGLEEQRAERLVHYYKEKIQRQLSEYNKLRNEEIHFSAEYEELTEASGLLDQLLSQLSNEARQGAQKDHFLHSMFNEMMEKENPEVKMTGEYLKKSAPVTSELFETLMVTSGTEKNALENLTDIESSFRGTLEPLVKQRSVLNEKLIGLRESYDHSQEKKRTLFDDRAKALNEVDALKLELEFLQVESVKLG